MISLTMQQLNDIQADRHRGARAMIPVIIAPHLPAEWCVPAKREDLMRHVVECESRLGSYGITHPRSVAMIAVVAAWAGPTFWNEEIVNRTLSNQHLSEAERVQLIEFNAMREPAP
ncbi:hypothetical protein GE253_00930 [Niveispirillum sp. SYP-B3756]|uniref:hypothetical protein n=1 Tax=Niveispirillum sp. SYP-B3756 TaxID=2662178 RepID=UPI0012929FA1|nr:hypothetical protein [Niveispirillum sp. SYP-B3756]MQP63899.1 hypothetical protein [Niveispirillum sp. SYP-B3756]